MTIKTKKTSSSPEVGCIICLGGYCRSRDLEAFDRWVELAEGGINPELARELALIEMSAAERALS